MLDLGYGEGTNTRLLKKGAAADVLGVDISHEMIRLAEDAEKAEPLGCRYRVADVADLSLEESFDLVVGAFLLNHASKRVDLVDFCAAIARALKPGGRFVGLNLNMAIEPEHYDDCRKYGRWQTTTAERKEGDMISVFHRNPDGSEMRLDNYYLSPETYAAAAAEAGLRDFAWIPLTVSSEGRDAFPSGYWDDFFKTPQVVGMEARK
ncbi:class I SAM-dependent methyltransferase [Hoeflea sp. TYP-13]|uniref:class I SAM-dependent methyltransferase n=1 Tax=Hoeflea sp. TYP-13 TaxID=3230023 RepID=UPI0034C6D3B9